MRILSYIIEWHSTYSFFFITIFILIAFTGISRLKTKKLYREAKWLKNGLIILLVLDLLGFIIPRILFNMFI